MARPPTRRPGELRDRIKVERRKRGAGDGAGNWEEAWVAIATGVAACIEPVRGGEVVIAGRLAGTAAFNVWVRADSAGRKITPGDRIVDVRDPARSFNVRFAENLDQRNRYILLQCDAGVGE